MKSEIRPTVEQTAWATMVAGEISRLSEKEAPAMRGWLMTMELARQIAKRERDK